MTQIKHYEKPDIDYVTDKTLELRYKMVNTWRAKPEYESDLKECIGLIDSILLFVQHLPMGGLRK